MEDKFLEMLNAYQKLLEINWNDDDKVKSTIGTIMSNAPFNTIQYDANDVNNILQIFRTQKGKLYEEVLNEDGALNGLRNIITNYFNKKSKSNESSVSTSSNPQQSQQNSTLLTSNNVNNVVPASNNTNETQSVKEITVLEGANSDDINKKYGTHIAIDYSSANGVPIGIDKESGKTYSVDTSNGQLTLTEVTNNTQSSQETSNQPSSSQYTEQDPNKKDTTKQSTAELGADMNAMNAFTRTEVASLTESITPNLKSFNESIKDKGFKLSLGSAIKGSYKESQIVQYKVLTEKGNDKKETQSTNLALEFQIKVTPILITESNLPDDSLKLIEDMELNVPDFIKFKEADELEENPLSKDNLILIRDELLTYLTNSKINIKSTGTIGKQKDQEIKIPVSFGEGTQPIIEGTDENPVGIFTITALKGKEKLSGYSKALNIAKAFGTAAGLVNTTHNRSTTTKF